MQLIVPQRQELQLHVHRKPDDASQTGECPLHIQIFLVPLVSDTNSDLEWTVAGFSAYPGMNCA